MVHGMPLWQQQVPIPVSERALGWLEQSGGTGLRQDSHPLEN